MRFDQTCCPICTFQGLSEHDLIEHIEDCHTDIYENVTDCDTDDDVDTDTYETSSNIEYVFEDAG
jgi:hypothetical protein